MKSDEKFIVGKWQLGNHSDITGTLDMSGMSPFLTINYFESERKGFSEYYDVATTDTSSQDKVSLLGLSQTSNSMRGYSNFQEYTFKVEKVILGEILSATNKLFSRMTFNFRDLEDEFFYLLKEELKTVTKAHLKIELDLERKEIKQKTDKYELTIHYGGWEGGRNGKELKYKSYAYIEVISKQKKSINDFITIVKELEDLFIFLTKRYRTAQDIELYKTKKVPPMPVEVFLSGKIKEELKESYTQPLFPLTRNNKILKKIILGWTKIFDKESLNFRLFSSELTQKSQYLDNTFFNIASMIDNLLIQKYGKRLTKSSYSNLKYAYIQERLKVNIKRASFKDRLLKFIASLDSKLHPKFHFLTSEIKNTNNVDYDEFLSDLIIDLRDAVAHGEKRQEYLYNIYLISKFIGLWLLLERLGLSDIEIKRIVDNMPINFF